MQSAQVAAKALDGTTPIEIIDSLSASMGIGNLVLHAARRGARRRRRSRRSSARSRRAASREHVFAALDTLEYLRKGGRIGGAQAMLGSMLSIKPIISVLDGAVESAGRVRTRSKALRFLVDQVPVGKVELISVLHANAPDVDEFLAMLEPSVPDAEVTVGMIGPGDRCAHRPAGHGNRLDRSAGVSVVGARTTITTTRWPAGPPTVTAARSTQLLRNHTALVHGVCRRILGNPDDALDATQEALLAIARKIGSFDGRSKFSTWAYRVATNAALDEARRRARRPSRPRRCPRPTGHAADATEAGDRRPPRRRCRARRS